MNIKRKQTKRSPEAVVRREEETWKETGKGGEVEAEAEIGDMAAERGSPEETAVRREESEVDLEIGRIDDHQGKGRIGNKAGEREEADLEIAGAGQEIEVEGNEADRRIEVITEKGTEIVTREDTVTMIRRLGQC